MPTNSSSHDTSHADQAERSDTRAWAMQLLRQRMRSGLIASAIMFTLLAIMPATALAAKGDAGTSNLIQLALYLGGLSLLPFAVMTLTSFLRIVVVLSFLRSGLGAQNVPPNMVIIALALFLSLFVMGPTIDEINSKALQPYQQGTIQFDEALTNASTPLKKFMINQMRGASSRKEIQTFYRLAVKQTNKSSSTKMCASTDQGKPDKCLANEAQIAKYGADALPLRVIIPAFMISELKKAFIMGFAVLLPFLVIDMVISNILLSLGMFMLPPVVISLPFKILLFVLAGGWTMVVQFLVAGFNY